MGIVVKNTSKYGLLDLICPHSCRGCGCLGEVFCERCKKNLMGRETLICPLCKNELAVKPEHGKVVCRDCDLPFEAVVVGGWREGVLKELIKDYKYRAVRAAGEGLVDVLDDALSLAIGKDDWGEVVVVPLPTIGKHVRERGFDHTLDLAKRLARRRGWKMERLLGRAADTVQVGAKVAQRQEQAKRAYGVRGEVAPEKTYLLLDDVWTTGASVMGAAEAMRKAGAQKLMVAVLATGKTGLGEASEH